ncbi:aminotransferase class V-fold PLP-dependent enzyme, partial [bacterium]|nr:aminotransferase class V-fold PLP-dependent enzyme [bacterium]
GAQKNIGPAGVCVVVMKNSMLERSRGADLFTMLNYKTHVDKKSMFNTPPAFPVYMVGLVMKWLKRYGGIAEIEKVNNRKAKLIYDLFDNSGGFFRATAAEDSRSKMNVTFRLPTEELEAKAIADATEKGFLGLKGHRSVGGMRASIYNAVPYESVEALADFLTDFQKNNG